MAVRLASAAMVIARPIAQPEIMHASTIATQRHTQWLGPVTPIEAMLTDKFCLNTHSKNSG